MIGQGNITMGTQFGYDPGNFYVWRASDGFAIHLSLNMVTQLTAQIARTGGKSQPDETRGILLGRSIETPFRATVIDDFKLIPASADGTNGDVDDAIRRTLRPRSIFKDNCSNFVGDCSGIFGSPD